MSADWTAISFIEQVSYPLMVLRGVANISNKTELNLTYRCFL